MRKDFKLKSVDLQKMPGYFSKQERNLRQYDLSLLHLELQEEKIWKVKSRSSDCISATVEAVLKDVS